MKYSLLIFSAFRDRKHYTIYTILITLIFALALIICINYDFYDYQINDVIGAREVNRGLVLYYEDENIENLVDELKYVDNYSPLYENLEVKSGKTIYKINSNFQKEIYYGKNIESENEILISILYFRNERLSEKDIGNTMIKLTYNKKNYDFKIVGVTDDNHAHFYLNNKALEHFLDIKPSKYYILVDSYPNVSKVINDLEENSYAIEYYDSSNLYEIEMLQKTKQTYLYLRFLLITGLTVFFNSIIKNIYTSELKNISLYKTIGFKNKAITKIIIGKISLIISFSFLLVLCLSITSSLLINIKYVNNLSTLKYLSITFMFKMLILILISFKISTKTKKINITEHLK